MRKILSIYILILLSVASLQAQNTIDIKNYNQYTNVTLKMSLKDADTDEPIAYATVYLTPQNDTLITNFAVSDEEINIGISLQKGNTELCEKINAILETMTADDFVTLMNDAIAVQPLSE